MTVGISNGILATAFVNQIESPLTEENFSRIFFCCILRKHYKIIFCFLNVWLSSIFEYSQLNMQPVHLFLLLYLQITCNYLLSPPPNLQAKSVS